MKLVETEIPRREDGADEVAETPTPPRPERRQVYVSLALTTSILIATVVAVYAIFPKRDQEVLRAAMAAHESPGDFALERPTAQELKAWTIGILGRGVIWPEVSAELEVLGVSARFLLDREAALVRFRAAGEEVSLLAIHAREALPRTFRLEHDGLYAVSWRVGKFKMIAVGPAGTAAAWGPLIGVP